MSLTPVSVTPNATPEGEILVSFIDDKGIPVNKLIRKDSPDLPALQKQFDDLESSREVSEQLMSDTISKAQDIYKTQLDTVITPARKVIEDLAASVAIKLP